MWLLQFLIVFRLVHHSQQPSNCCFYALFTFRNSGSDQYNCINSRQNSLFAAVSDILKRRCERYENQWWIGDVVQQLANISIQASNCCITWMLCNKIQTSLKIVKLLHKLSNHTITWSNSLHNSMCCTNCWTVYGALYTPSRRGWQELIFRGRPVRLLKNDVATVMWRETRQVMCYVWHHIEVHSSKYHCRGKAIITNSGCGFVSVTF